MANVYLSQRDIDYISRVVATEVPSSLKQTDPAEYDRMVNAVVDTMVNRVASGSYPDTITGVANQSRQFSKITGPASLDPYGSVQNTPKASQALQSQVAGRVADLAQGADSEINGALSYANPNFSDAKNLADWVNPMIEAGAVKLGLGDMVHYHGLAPGQQAVEDVTVSAEGIPSGDIPVPFGPNDDPLANSAQAQATDGLSGVLNPVAAQTVERSQLASPSEWGVLNGVGPVYTPTVNAWADVAAANPVKAPFGSILAGGDLAANAPLEAQTRAVPMMNVPATGLLGAATELSAATKAGVPGGPSGFFDGIVTPGNIDLANRPVVTLPDGSIATVRSMSFENNAGNEVLVPTVSPQGEMLTDQQAKELYGTTGQHLGIFDNPTNADKYAEALHQAQENYYAARPNVTANASLATTPGLEANAAVGPMAQPGFDVSRFDGLAPGVAPVDASRFASDPKTDRIGTSQTMADPARMNPLTGAINPATNTQSFMPDPAATGVYSAEHQQVQDAARAALDRALQTQAQRQAAASVTPSGILGTPTELAATATANVPTQTAGLLANPAMTTPNFAQAVNPTVPGLLGAPIDPMPTAAVTPTPVSVATPQQMANGYNQAAQGLRQAGILNIGQQPPTDLSGNLPTNFDAFATAPAIEDVTVADQPSIADQSATFDGPATTPALTQQKNATTDTLTQPTKTQPTVQAAQNTKSFKDSLFSKETALGGLLGGLALGPVGGILGAIGGQQVAANGGLTGLLGGGFAQPTTQIPGGIVNIGGIYGGRYAPGTYAMANNGAQISSLGGGYTGMVTPSGQHEVISPTGQISHNFGSFGSRPSDPNAAV